MSPLIPSLRLSLRAFHSPFVALTASPRLSSPTPVYEKQTESSSEPHLSSSGTRTYVVSEPDPSDTPYEVPSGAYPISAPYINHAPRPPHTHPNNPHTASAGNTQAHGEARSSGIGLVDATTTKQGRF